MNWRQTGDDDDESSAQGFKRDGSGLFQDVILKFKLTEEKSTKDLSQDRLQPDSNSNRVPSKYKSLSSQGVKLTTHLHLVPRSKNAWRYTFSLPIRLQGSVTR
jgi:hypothetical protein